MIATDRMLLVAHQGNVRRYSRILKTYLTDFEREFIEHRLFEEQEAIRAILGKGRPACRLPHVA